MPSLTTHPNRIENQVTGQIIIFQSQASSKEDALLMETIYPPFSQEPPTHFHPYQREVFNVSFGSFL